MLTARDIRPTQITDLDVVSAAERVEIDMLDVIQIHRDGRDVAEEAHPLAVGRDVDFLGDVGAVEEECIRPVPTLDDVAAIARIPLEDVVARAEKGSVVAAIPVDEIVAVAADKKVRARAAEERVVARAAVHRDLHDAGRERCCGDHVVAARPLTVRVSWPFGIGDMNECGQAGTEMLVPAPTMSTTSPPFVALHDDVVDLRRRRRTAECRQD